MRMGPITAWATGFDRTTDTGKAGLSNPTGVITSRNAHAQFTNELRRVTSMIMPGQASALAEVLAKARSVTHGTEQDREDRHRKREPSGACHKRRRRHVRSHEACNSENTAAVIAGSDADEVRERVIAQLPEELFPGSARSGWWMKTVQLDLEAKETSEGQILIKLMAASESNGSEARGPPTSSAPRSTGK